MGLHIHLDVVDFEDCFSCGAYTLASLISYFLSYILAHSGCDDCMYMCVCVGGGGAGFVIFYLCYSSGCSELEITLAQSGALDSRSAGTSGIHIDNTRD